MNAKLLRTTLLATLIATLCACGDRDAAGATAVDPASSSADGLADSADLAAADLAAAQAPDPEDPCRLLEPGEVEAVLGAPLAGAPFRAGQPNGDSAGIPDETGNWCWYETATHRNLAVAATWENGGAILGGIAGHLDKAETAGGGLLKLQDGSELSGDWDEAKVTGCCDFIALQGDAYVEIDVGGSPATLAQAGELANLALPRLVAPLSIDGDAGNAAAQQRLDARYELGEDACALWTPADIERLLGPPQGEPERHSGNECTYSFRKKNGQNSLFVATTETRNGYRTYRSENATFAGMAASISAEGASEGVGLRASRSVEGPWEAADDGPIQFNSVRNDASIAVRHSGLSHDDLRALLGHAYDRIEGKSP